MRATDQEREREHETHKHTHKITRFECGIHFLRLTIDLIAANIFGLVWVNEKKKNRATVDSSVKRNVHLDFGSLERDNRSTPEDIYLSP